MANNDPMAVRRFGHYEPAARNFCERQGINPDEDIAHSSAEFSDSGPGFYTSNICYSAKWLFVAREMDSYVKRDRRNQLFDICLLEDAPEYDNSVDQPPTDTDT